MKFRTELKGSFKVEGPACKIKEAGGLFNIYALVDRYMMG
jgi:hypothetical protein